VGLRGLKGLKGLKGLRGFKVGLVGSERLLVFRLIVIYLAVLKACKQADWL
jgi:hypothetical protein